MIEEIKKVIEECSNIGNILEKIGIINNGYNYKKVKSIIENNRLDTSHFKSRCKYYLIKKECPKCGKEFETMNGGKNSKKYCSLSCSNSRPMRDEIKSKISRKNTKITKDDYNLVCINCGVGYYRKPSKVKKSKYCSKSCSALHRNKNGLARKGGLQSIKAQSKLRRSKNEILFSEKCDVIFNDIKVNEPMFNGWDADVIIEDYKLAVLWNGKWHYEKITEKHSVEQVQNRDRIKIEEIKKCGYTPYIIKDMGKYNPDKVVSEIKRLLEFLNI